MNFGDSRRGYIDIIRAVAIIGVFLFHVKLFLIHSPGAVMDSILSEGSRGVQLFFFLSAYLLFSNFDRMRYVGQTEQTLRYTVKRIFRIVPLFYFCGIMAFLFFQQSIASVVLSSTFLAGFNPAFINSMVPNQWTLMIEMMFYVALPFLFLKIRDRQTAWKYFMVSLVASNCLLFSFDLLITKGHMFGKGIWDNYAFFSFPVQLPFFMFGILIFFLFKQKVDMKEEMKKLVCQTIVVEFLFALMMFVLTGNFFLNFRKSTLYVYSIAAFSLSVLLINSYDRVRRFPLFRRTLEYIGKISYSIYLTHWFMLFLVTQTSIYMPLVRRMNFYGEFVFLSASAFPLTVAVSSLTYRFIENPGQKLGSIIIERIRTKQTVSDII